MRPPVQCRSESDQSNARVEDRVADQADQLFVAKWSEQAEGLASEDEDHAEDDQSANHTGPFRAHQRRSVATTPEPVARDGRLAGVLVTV